MRSWLFALCATATATAGSALAQGVEAPVVPRLDEKPVAQGFVFNQSGMAVPGHSCHLLRVQKGEVFSVAGSIPNQQPVLEFVDGGRCIFARETEHLPRLTAKADATGKTALIRIDRPGFYSVRLMAEGADRTTRGVIVATRLAE